MKKPIRTYFVAICLASAATLANADTAANSTTVPAARDWSGFYLGSTYGIRSGGDMDYVTAGGGTISYSSLEPGKSLGVFAGYNIQRNNLVFGGELAYSRVNTPGFGPVGFPTETFNYFADGKVRIGLATGNALVYGFAGYTGSEFTNSAGSWTVSGANYGIGVDVMVNDRFFVGTEYIIRNLSGATSNPGQTQDTNIRAFQIRAGLKF